MSETVITLPFSPAVSTVLALVALVFLGSLAVFALLRHQGGGSEKLSAASHESSSPWPKADTWPKAILFSLILSLWLPMVVMALLAGYGLLGSYLIQTLPTEPSTLPDKNIGAGALILGLIGGPFVIWSTYIKHRNLELNRDSHSTDLVTKAVGYLGSYNTRTTLIDGVTKEVTDENIAARIGGLLTLDRVAKDAASRGADETHIQGTSDQRLWLRQDGRVTGCTT